MVLAVEVLSESFVKDEALAAVALEKYELNK